MPENSTKHPESAQFYRSFRFEKGSLTGAEAFFGISRQRIEQAIKNLVDREGPAHKETIKRKIADHFSARMGKRISGELDRVIMSAVINRLVTERRDFLWPNGMTVPPLRIYNKGGSKREIEEIPPEEIGLAILECVRNSIGISEDGVTREVARLFGLRAGKNTVRPIKQVINHLIRYKALAVKGNKLVVVNKRK